MASRHFVGGCAKNEIDYAPSFVIVVNDENLSHKMFPLVSKEIRATVAEEVEHGACSVKKRPPPKSN